MGTARAMILTTGVVNDHRHIPMRLTGSNSSQGPAPLRGRNAMYATLCCWHSSVLAGGVLHAGIARDEVYEQETAAFLS